MTRRRRAGLLLLLAVEALAIMWLVLNPSPATPIAAVDSLTDLLHGRGVPPEVARPEYVEFVLNVALFVPLGALATGLWPSVPRWRWVGGAVTVRQRRP